MVYTNIDWLINITEYETIDKKIVLELIGNPVSSTNKNQSYSARSDEEQNSISEELGWVNS